MPEIETIKDFEKLITVASLVEDFQALGVPETDTLLVHSSLSALGWVSGGAQAVIEALIQSMGEGGTLVLPAHSAVLSNPANWINPPVRSDWWEPIRASMPAFHPHLTPTRAVGVIPELFRSQPDVQRSNHPAYSFAARGPLAARILAEHRLEDGFGETSPLAALYDLDAAILLLGVGYESCTMLHLAERRAAGKDAPSVREGAPILENGQRVWKEYDEPSVSSDDFAALGTDFESDKIGIKVGCAGRSQSRLISASALVDFAVPWLKEHR